MTFYPGIDPATEEGRRIAARLLSIKSLLKKKDLKKGGIPHKTLDKSLLIATWNIRELGRNQKYGPRLFESLYFIAEIISAFDVIALQEVNENLTDLRRIMSLLGPAWKYLLTDITLGRQGNAERMAFLYDSRKVTFEGLASQVVVPPDVRRGKKIYHPGAAARAHPDDGGFQVRLVQIHYLHHSHLLWQGGRRRANKACGDSDPRGVAGWTRAEQVRLGAKHAPARRL